jgi:RecA/RadA recombinase
VPVSLAPRSALAGREGLLAQLDAQLTAGAVSAPRIVVLCGLGGAGKTSVAVEYAYRHLAEVGVAWQFAAEDGTVLAAGFGELAAQLGERGLADVRDPVVSVHAVLAGSASPWLVIFDNAADLASVAAFLPPAGPGRVLITSQNASWPGQVMDVPMLEVGVAAGFLVNRTGDPDLQAASDLAGALGGLPLALEQAAAYVQASGSTLAGYLTLFRRRRAEMLVRGEPAGYRGTVASTWALTFVRLEHAAPSAAGLLRLLAFWAPEAIPLRRLLKPRPGLAGQFGEDVAPALMPLLEDRLTAGDAVAALRRYSLLAPAADRSVSVHRLVQAVTADQMPAELAGQWRQAAATLIEAAIPRNTTLRKAWPVCAALLSHAQAALDLTGVGMWRVARYLGFSGSYPAARDLFQLIADAYRQDNAFGAEHQNTLAARQEVALMTGQAGDPVAARDLFHTLLPVYEQALGLEHPHTLTARAGLARWTGEAGNPAAARELFDALLPVRERVLGPEHPDTLTTRGNLARWTGGAGNPAAARDQYAALLPVRERVSGLEHPDTLNTRAGLARWTGEAGNPAAARELFDALLPVRERVLGLEHPDTLNTRADLAYWTGRAGDAGAARDQFTALLPAFERVLGPEHLATLAARGSLASWTLEATRRLGSEAD